MIIHCPECNARYNLTAAQIGAEGRSVRCVKCSHEWFQPPAEPEIKYEQPPLPPINDDVPTMKKKKEQQAKPNKTFIIAIAASVAFIFIAAGMFAFKGMLFSSGTTSEEEMASMQDMQSNTGLIIGKVNRTIVEDGDLSILVFTGTITNTNVTNVEVSPVRVSLYNDQGIELDSFPALPNKSILPAGETTKWVCRFFNPPVDKIYEYKASFDTKS